MTIVLPSLAVGFAALCVWLAVRIVNRRERWAKRTLAGVVGIPVLYVASFGPAWRLSNQEWCPQSVYSGYCLIYAPLRWLRVRGPYPLHDFVNWYAEFCWDGPRDYLRENPRLE